VLPKAFRLPKDPIYAPLYDANRGMGVTNKPVNNGDPIDTTANLIAMMNEALCEASYIIQGPDQGFNANLDWNLHGTVHGDIGGDMGSVPTAANDPIFWMHHCNIDRLYSNWLTRPKHNPPPDTTWKNKSFNDFFDRKGNPVGSQFTCGATVDSKVMGYIYDTDAPIHLTQLMTSTSAAPSAAKTAVVASMVATKATTQAGVLSFVSEAAPPDETRRFLNAAALGATDYVARLQIEGLKSPARQNTGVHVFIGSGITTQTPITAPGYVGSFTFFEGHGEGSGSHAHEGARTVLLNASDALKRLYGDTSLPSGVALNVSLITRPLYTGVSAFAAVGDIQPDKVQLDVVNLNA
jgi:tyrosinase